MGYMLHVQTQTKSKLIINISINISDDIKNRIALYKFGVLNVVNQNLKMREATSSKLMIKLFYHILMNM